MIYASYLGLFISGILLVGIVSFIAWIILSKWLLDRSLVIGCVACGVTAGLVRFAYGGPMNGALGAALSGILGTFVGGVVIGRWWLRRVSSEVGY